MSVGEKVSVDQIADEGDGSKTILGPVDVDEGYVVAP